jgi:hypothetical protein
MLAQQLFSPDRDTVPKHRKSLKELKSEADDLGYGPRKWAALAGIPWQTVYKRLANERSCRLFEYDRLAAAVDKMKSEHAAK